MKKTKKFQLGRRCYKYLRIMYKYHIYSNAKQGFPLKFGPK